MVRKRRKGTKLQDRINEMCPPEVQAALAEESRGVKIPTARQVYLVGLMVAAIEDKQHEIMPDVKGAWVVIRLIGGKLRAYRFWRDGANVISEYIGAVGEG